MFQNDFKDLIFDRLNETVSTLRKTNTEYKKATEKYDKLYNDLLKTLTPEQEKIFDDLCNTQNWINALEQQALYITALHDTVDLTNKQYITKIK